MNSQIHLAALTEGHRFRLRSLGPQPLALGFAAGVKRVDARYDLLPELPRPFPSVGETDRVQWTKAHVMALAVKLVSEDPAATDAAVSAESGLQIQICTVRQ
jgi:hypothetical protein